MAENQLKAEQRLLCRQAQLIGGGGMEKWAWLVGACGLDG